MRFIFTYISVYVYYRTLLYNYFCKSLIIKEINAWTIKSITLYTLANGQMYTAQSYLVNKCLVVLVILVVNVLLPLVKPLQDELENAGFEVKHEISPIQHELLQSQTLNL